MWSAKDIALFTLIQLVNLPLTVAGWFMTPAIAQRLWLWGNDDDASLLAQMTPWRQYVYLSWRNPVANLRHVRGVSGVGRPLFYRTYKNWYVKFGWMSNGYPCMSAGSGRGY